MKSEQYTLIEGVFAPIDAQEILLSIFTQKIQFQKTKNFSSHERNGEQEAFAVKRIKELITDTEQLKTVLEMAKKEKKQIAVSAMVHLSFVD